MGHALISGMVAVAAIATGPGIEPGTRSASSGEAVAGMPFTASLVAEMAVTGSEQSGGPETIEGAPPVATDDCGPRLVLKDQTIPFDLTAKEIGKKGDVLVQVGPSLTQVAGRAKLPLLASSAKVSVAHSDEREAASVTGVVPKLGEIEVAADVSSSLDDKANKAMDTPSVTIQPPLMQEGDSTTPATRGIDVSVGAPTEIPNSQQGVEKGAEQGRNQPLLSATEVFSASRKTIPGDGGGVAKKEKTEKASKADADKLSGGKIESIGSVVVVEVPVATPQAVPSGDLLQKGPPVQQDSSNSSLPSSMKVIPGAGTKVTSIKNRKADKEPDGVKSLDEKTGEEVASQSLSESGVNKTDLDKEKREVEASVPKPEENDGAAALAMAPGHIQSGVGSITGAAPEPLVHAPVLPAKSEQAGSHGATIQQGMGLQTGVNGNLLRSADASPRTLQATPTVLEVGVANSTHGWLKIRAEMTGTGTVDASLATASPSGQEMLHRELPSLLAYLHNERVAVNTITVQPATQPALDFRGHTGMSGEGQRQTGQNGGQPSGDSRQSAARFRESPVYRVWSESGREESVSYTPYASGGSWLSVRA